ncbi:MAG TPA: hypothetical protein VE890_07120 [Thermoguttaceae bacterium]|nr:hypothetical protein [Thermoguttaceae bacterium]
MNDLRAIWQTLRTLTVAAACWLAVHGTALAQATEEKKSKESWVMSYFLILLVVGLGMLVVCRSSRRRDRAKPESYSGSKGDEPV